MFVGTCLSLQLHGGPTSRNMFVPLCLQVQREQKDLCGGLRSVRVHPRTHGLPGQHPGNRLLPGHLAAFEAAAWCFVLSQRFSAAQILESDKRISLGQNETGFSCDGSASTFRVMFKEPVELLPNVSYTACATLKVSPPNPPPPSTTRASCSLCPSVAPSGSGLPLRHQGFEENDPRVHDRDQDHLSLLQLPWKQQRHVCGGRTDPRDHLLHLERRETRRSPDHCRTGPDRTGPDWTLVPQDPLE